MAAVSTLKGRTLKGRTLKGRTLILAAPQGGMEPAVLPITVGGAPPEPPSTIWTRMTMGVGFSFLLACSLTVEVILKEYAWTST